MPGYSCFNVILELLLSLYSLAMLESRMSKTNRDKATQEEKVLWFY